MRPELWIVGLLIFGVFISVGVSLYAELIFNYELDEAGDPELFAELNNTITESLAESERYKANTKGNPTSTDTAENDLFSGGFSTLRTVWNSVSIGQDALTGIGQKTAFGDDTNSNIVARIFSVIGIILGVLLTFTVINYIFRFMPRG